VKRVANALLALGFAAPLAAAAALSPAAVEGGPILCWLRAATGLRCPFCGMTRSFVYLAHGALGASVGAHPAGPILFLALALAALLAFAASVRGDAPIGGRRDFLRFAQAVGVLCIAVGLVAHVLENRDGALLDLLHAG
jgi:hypothetical protein